MPASDPQCHSPAVSHHNQPIWYLTAADFEHLRNWIPQERQGHTRQLSIERIQPEQSVTCLLSAYLIRERMLSYGQSQCNNSTPYSVKMAVVTIHALYWGVHLAAPPQAGLIDTAMCVVLLDRWGDDDESYFWWEYGMAVTWITTCGCKQSH